MSFVSSFAASTAALRSNAAAFKVIGDNIANSVTPGYKAADTRFSEVLASNPTSIFDSYGGNRPIIQNFIDKQGTFEQTLRPSTSRSTAGAFWSAIPSWTGRASTSSAVPAN